MTRNTVDRAAVPLLAVLLLSAAVVHAADYPSRPVRLVVPFAPGGGTDIVARLVARQVSGQTGQSIVVDNRAGAGGNIGTDLVAKAQADGYTLLMAYASHASNPGLYAKLPFDPVRDFAAIAQIATAANMLVVHPSLPVRTLGDLTQFLRAKPDAMSYGSGGIGTPNHLAGELYRVMAGLKVSHVAYKGIGPSNTAQVAGEVQFSFPALFTIVPHVKAGRVRAIAVTSLARSPLVPDTPTMSEAGLSGFEAVSWYGLMAPAGTPAAIVGRLNREVVAAVANAEVRETLRTLGTDPATGTPAEFSALVRAEIAKWGRLIRDAGIKPE